MQTSDVYLLLDLLGFLISISSIAIVANVAQTLSDQLRQGMLAMIWGLVLIAASFAWAISTGWLVLNWPDLRPIILSFGMIILLISVTKLFSIYRPSNV